MSLKELKPIIISETEEIEVGDNICVNEVHDNIIKKYGDDISIAKSSYSVSKYVQKILAFVRTILS